MSTATAGDATRVLETRILREGYGEGAWHGPDLKAALVDVTDEAAFWRPAPDRHNIAEIAMHHAYCAHAVRAKLASVEPEPFVLAGEDWFALGDSSVLPWPTILHIVAFEQERLAQCCADLEASPLTESERFDLVLGITSHAVYHAGQIQLIKRLRAAHDTR